jgi:phosphatidylglycerol---prolipoprotein diacylglyceryl transferase
MIHEFPLTIGHVLGLPIYWYGAVYTLGFLGVFLWFWLRRGNLGWSRRDVVEFTIFIALGVLIGGRAFDIIVYELDYYRQNPLHALNWWKGGLATHGVLLGGSIAAAAFCFSRHKPFLRLADEIVVPAALLLALARLGNFVEGGVIGTTTALPWGVVYQDLEGARHPVALYDGVKNAIIGLVLMGVLRRYPAGHGIAMSLFILLYGLLRVFVDLFRDYESYWMGLGKGQFFNLGMAFLGLFLLVLFSRNGTGTSMLQRAREERVGLSRQVILLFLLVYPLGIPTSWTQANIEQKRQESLSD